MNHDPEVIVLYGPKDLLNRYLKNLSATLHGQPEF
jgi:hypothetical protein